MTTPPRDDDTSIVEAAFTHFLRAQRRFADKVNRLDIVKAFQPKPGASRRVA